MRARLECGSTGTAVGTAVGTPDGAGVAVGGRDGASLGAAVGTDTYRDTWAKIYGEKTVLLPDITVVFMTAVAGLSYAIILGDSFASIAKLAGAPATLHASNNCILLLSAFVRRARSSPTARDGGAA